ncbi:Ankyrin repeat A protein 2 [Homalodisca vitripennis]|nr:Ankyrin repeat A protein 2 [Homalodisca vitripennis]
MPTPATPTDAMSWFMVCGRGDILKEDLEEMLAQDKDIDETDDEGLSGMMWAAFYGQIHTVQIFLECGVEVDRQGIWGETALMLAATEGHLEIVRMLILAGANVNHEDHVDRQAIWGETALMLAATEGHL